MSGRTTSVDENSQSQSISALRRALEHPKIFGSNRYLLSMRNPREEVGGQSGNASRQSRWTKLSHVCPFVLYSLRHTFLTRLGNPAVMYGHWSASLGTVRSRSQRDMFIRLKMRSWSHIEVVQRTWRCAGRNRLHF
jgi:hypothetical protein